MMSIPNGRVRGIALRPERRRFLLQQGLVASYRAWQPYRNTITIDLRPLWQCIASRYSWAPHTSLHVVEALTEDQRFDEEDGLGPHDQDLRAYVERVGATIMNLMGLRVAGAVAPWVREYVHLDAASQQEIGQAPGPAYADFPKWERTRIEFDVSEGGARLVVEAHDGSKRAGPEIDAGVYLSFTKWEELRRAAHEVVEQEIDRLRGTFEGTYTSGYASRLMNEQARLPPLREALTATPRNRPTHDEATWKALDRLADVVGIDPPQH